MSRLPRALPVAAFALLFVAAAFAGYQQVFGTFAPYDDEGYVMLSVASYLRGLPLYEEVYTQYGPALFVIEGGFHRLTGLPITHDVVRLRTLAMWLATALLAGAVTRRLTGSPLLGFAGFGLAFLHLERFCLEPGHPQEICALGMLAAILLASYLPRCAKRAWIPMGLGVGVGVVLMTKLNIGVFLIAGLALALAMNAPQTRLGRATRVAVIVGAVLLPVLVTAEQLHTPSGWPLPAAALGGVTGLAIFRFGSTKSASVLGAASADRRLSRSEGNATFAKRKATIGQCLNPGDGARSMAAALDQPVQLGVRWFVAGVGVTCAAFAGTVLAQGTSAARLWYGLVGQHRGFAGPFYHPAPVEPVAALVALTGAALAWWMSRRRRIDCGAGPFALAVRGVVALLFVAVVWRYWVETSTPLIHGLNDRGGAGLLVSFATPLAWIVVLPIRVERNVVSNSTVCRDFGRLALCAVAVLQPLGAFPVPGTQMAVGSLPLLLVCLVAAGDLLNEISRRVAGWSASGNRLAIQTAVILAVAATLAYRDLSLWRYRSTLTPLDMPGASLLRVPQETAEQQQWLARTLRDNAGAFVFGQYARNSFYFWTGRLPPTGFNATVWPYLLRPEHQRRIVAALKDRPDVYVVREKFAAAPPQGETPLADYLAARFRLDRAHGRFEVWTER